MLELKYFYNINKKFIDKKISVVEYDIDFFNLKKKLHSHMQGNDWCIVDDIEDWIQRYEPNKKIREAHSDYLNEDQLREGIKEIQKKIEKIFSERNKKIMKG